MNIFNNIVFLFILLFSFNINAFPIPEKNKAVFDIIRKDKVIGKHEIFFSQKNGTLELETVINIDVKVLFFNAYKFRHESREIWKNENFIKIKAYTDFEDEREYFINGIDKNEYFFASGMDGELKLNINILPSNFWNINVLKQKEVFDTQKGIVRKIEVEELGFETIKINNISLKCQKFKLNASNNPKDKGPFPEYTLWYTTNDELVKFKFRNWKDNKIVTIVRNFQEEN